jgi:hypothetical protein
MRFERLSLKKQIEKFLDDHFFLDMALSIGLLLLIIFLFFAFLTHLML